MGQRLLVVRVTLVEQDEDGNVVSRLCDHAEHSPLSGVPAEVERTRHDYIHWAYRGFQVARNGPLGLIEPAPGVPRLTLVVLKTLQVEAVRAFYAALGVRFAEEQHGDGPRHYAGQLGPVVLEVYPLLKAEDTADATTRLGFGVDDAAAAVAALLAQGLLADIPQWRYGDRLAVVRDPDGRAVELATFPSSLR